MYKVTQPLRHEQDVTQGDFLRTTAGLSPEFLSSVVASPRLTKWLVQLFTHGWERLYGFIP